MFFLTGTDEHGIKIYRTAEEQGITARELADKNSTAFRELARLLNISHDDFIRTSEDRHIRGAQEFWQRIEKREDLDERPFTGNIVWDAKRSTPKKNLKMDVVPFIFVRQKNSPRKTISSVFPDILKKFHHFSLRKNRSPSRFSCTRNSSFCRRWFERYFLFSSGEVSSVGNSRSGKTRSNHVCVV